MAWIVVVVIFAAWMPAKALAQKWRKGPMVPVAALSGIVSAVVATGLVALALHMASPDSYPVKYLINRVMAFLPWSVLIAPVAATIGWRKAKSEGWS